MNQTRKQAYLRSTECNFTLAPKLTVIGRESCDFVIQNITVDNQHAVIEYLEHENCFILKDLNSTHGSYVNDCRVQNVSVRLKNGDILRFGFSSGLYEFYAEEEQPELPSQDTLFQNSAPIHPHPLQTQPNIGDHITLPNIISQPPVGLSHRYTMPNMSSASYINQHQNAWSSQVPLPPPSQNPNFNSNIPLNNKEFITGPNILNPQKLLRPQSVNSICYNKRQLTPSAPVALTNSNPNSRKQSTQNSSRAITIDLNLNSGSISSQKSERDQQQRTKFSTELPQQYSKIPEDHEMYTQPDNPAIDEQQVQLNNESIMTQLSQLTQELSRRTSENQQLQGLLEKTISNEQSLNNSQNSNNSNNLSNNNRIIKENDKLKRDLQVCQGLVTTLQKENGQKDEEISKLRRDFETARHELNEKDITIGSIMNKLSKVQDVEEYEKQRRELERENIGLKQKLESSDASMKEYQANKETFDKTTKDTNEKLEQSLTEIQNVKKQLGEIELANDELRKTESILRIDLEKERQKYQNFRDNLSQVIQAIPGTKKKQEGSEDIPLKDEEILEKMNGLLNSKIEHDLRMCEKDKQITESQNQLDKIIGDLNKFYREVQKILQTENDLETISSNENVAFKDALISLIVVSSNEELNHELDSIKALFIDLLERSIQRQIYMESCVADLDPELREMNLKDCFKRLSDDCKESQNKFKKMEEALNKEIDENSVKIEDLKKVHAEEIQEKAALIEEIQAESSQKAILEEEHTKQVQKLSENISKLEKEIQEYQETIQNNEAVMTQHQVELATIQQSASQQTEEIEKLSRRITEISEEKISIQSSITEQLETAEDNWKSEIDIYKQETTQHAITIETMNSNLTKVTEENSELAKEVSELRKKLAKKEKEKKVGEKAVGEAVNNETRIEIANLERCIAALRHENVSLKSDVQQRDDSLKSISKDLAGAEARLSDLKSEMSEQQKTEVDRLQLELRKLDFQHNESLEQMAKMTSIVDGLKTENEEKSRSIKNLQDQVNELKTDLDMKQVKIEDLDAEKRSSADKWLHQFNKIEQEGRLATEMAVIGSQCKGDRHLQVIEAQKQALSELRQRVKTVEISGVGVVGQSNNDSARQVSQLKRELAEMRSKQALQDVAPPGMNSLLDIIEVGSPGNQSRKYDRKGRLLALTNGTSPNNDQEDGEYEKAGLMERESRELTKTNQKLEFDITFLKNSLAETNKSLEFSESSYISLVRQLMEALDIDKIKGLRSFDNLEFDAKSLLKKERDDACSLLIQKIRILREKIHRKEELLEGYEGDLVKLRQAENLVAKTQQQMEEFIEQMRNKGEEVDLLRETLKRTKELLNQEKRVNTSIKQHKNYVPEKKSSDAGLGNESKFSGKSPKPPSGKSPTVAKYHCPPPDLQDQEKHKEKIRLDKMKRKNYELKSLKTELYQKEKELSQASNRLHTLETTIGIKSEEPAN